MSRHDKDYNSSVKLSAYADLMLDRIDTCISDKISKSVTRLASAIVTKVNSDGSVNIRLPSEDNTEFTKIQNQCPYELKIGDAVELTLKNGSFNNCWVSAKHGMGTRATSEGSSGYITASGAPVQSVNGKTGAVQLTATDVGAISAADISQTLGNSSTKVPSEKAVADAMSAAGYGDMLKANYATKSDSIVDKSYADENGNNIASTYISKFKLLNNTDANSLITSQICVIGAGNTNLPDEATGSVLFVAGDGTNAFQIIVVYATNTLNHRAYKDGAWTIWRNTEAKTSTDSATNFDAYGLGFITEE